MQKKFSARIMHVLLAIIFLSSSAYAQDRILSVVFVRTAETNGSRASTATAQEFKKQIDRANQVYAGSGIQFAFDPNTGFPAVVNDTLLHHDWMLKPGESYASPKDKEPKVDGTLYAYAKNNYVRANFPGKLVVFSGVGDHIQYNDTLHKWERIDRTFAYSNSVDLFVQWFNSDVGDINLFSHEVGHYLHLWHTHGALPKNQAEFTDLVTKGLTQWGYTTANILDLFNGDQETVTDTPSDPGPEFWQAMTGDACSATNSVGFNYHVGFTNFTINVAPDRRNIMSYFKGCTFPELPHLSAQQASRARNSVEYGNRIGLRLGNPGILVPRWSPDIDAVSWSSGRLDLFAAGVDLHSVHKAFSSAGGWYPAMQYGNERWESLGGLIVGKPTAVAWGENRLDVFVRGLDNQIYHKAWDGSRWYPDILGFESLGGTLAGDPVGVSWAKNRLDIFARGFDGKIYHKWWSPQTGWGPSQQNWENLDGRAGSDPVAVAWGENRLDLVMRGHDGALYHKAWDGSHWWPSIDSWSNLGGSIVGKPAMTAWSANRLDIFVVGTDKRVYHKAWSGQNWYPSVTGFTSLGGSVTSDASAVSWSSGRLDIVVRGADTQLYHKAYQEGSGWYPSLEGWSSLGGYLLEGSNPKLVSWGPGRLDIFIRNTNFAIQHKAYDNANGWYPSLAGYEDIGKYVE